MTRPAPLSPGTVVLGAVVLLGAIVACAPPPTASIDTGSDAVTENDPPEKTKTSNAAPRASSSTSSTPAPQLSSTLTTSPPSVSGTAPAPPATSATSEDADACVDRCMGSTPVPAAYDQYVDCSDNCSDGDDACDDTCWQQSGCDGNAQCDAAQAKEEQCEQQCGIATETSSGDDDDDDKN